MVTVLNENNADVTLYKDNDDGNDQLQYYLLDTTTQRVINVVISDDGIDDVWVMDDHDEAIHYIKEELTDECYAVAKTSDIGKLLLHGAGIKLDADGKIIIDGKSAACDDDDDEEEEEEEEEDDDDDW